MNLTKRQRIILWIGGILIILRLFFPMERYSRSYGSSTDPFGTIFHCLAIGILIGLLLFMTGKK